MSYVLQCHPDEKISSAQQHMKAYTKISGYEKLELSTQLVIAEAIKRGAKAEILDAQDELIRFQKGNHIEYTKAGTITHHETYVTTNIIDNKYVCKKILKDHNINTPEGKIYENKKSAIEDYSFFKPFKKVIKPKSTNCGVGIMILEPNAQKSAYKKAIDLAFQYDQNIIIEKFVEGIECRFLVINEQTIAIANRIPANIIGDGKHTIQELIALKNKDPKRGRGYERPLVYLTLDKIEKQILKEQGFSPESKAKKHQQVFLRYNSNLSTGGDCIDYTEKVHTDYKKIAEKVAKILQKKVCGIDMIMQNHSKPSTTKNYSILEVNKNPSLSMHNFPSEGKNRKVETYIVDILGF